MTKYKYRYDDIDCFYCIENEKPCNNGKCKHKLCPYIMDNLADLFEDNNFCELVSNPKKCETNHKKTFEYLKRNGFVKIKRKRKRKKFPKNIRERCDYKADCQTCNYGATGFICFNEHDGTCLKDWLKSIKNGGINRVGSK